MQRYDPQMADSAYVEHEIDQCIIEAFTQTIIELQTTGGLQMNEKDLQKLDKRN